jgi:site-specific DNA recombinase
MATPTKKRRQEKVEITEAIGYVRVSTQEQAESGLGMEAQRRRLELYAESKGWHVVAIYQDAGISAKTLKDRPGLTQAIAELRPGRILLAYKLDRLTRTARHLDDLTALVEERFSAWACVEGDYDTSSAMGRFLADLVARIAQMERELIAERTSAALETKAIKGERLGATCLGYKTETGDDGQKVVVVDPIAQETVRMARALRSSGKSFRAVAAELTAAGRKTMRGGAWHASTVRLLIEPRYIERTQGRETDAGRRDSTA